jgi:hypothetical protein
MNKIISWLFGAVVSYFTFTWFWSWIFPTINEEIIQFVWWSLLFLSIGHTFLGAQCQALQDQINQLRNK